jgi:hypothetical protein
VNAFIPFFYGSNAKKMKKLKPEGYRECPNPSPVLKSVLFVVVMQKYMFELI